MSDTGNVTIRLLDSREFVELTMRQARSDIGAIGGDQAVQEDAEQYALDQMMISCHRLVKDHPEWNALDAVFNEVADRYEPGPIVP